MFNSYKRRKGRCSNINSYYAITICSYNKEPIFNDVANARLISRMLFDFSAENNLMTICYVVMPDHLHWIFQLKGVEELSRLVGKFKSITTFQYNRLNNCNGAIWQGNFYDHSIINDDDLINQARYVVANPLRAGLVKSVGDYPYWNCVYL